MRVEGSTRAHLTSSYEIPEVSEDWSNAQDQPPFRALFLLLCNFLARKRASLFDFCLSNQLVRTSLEAYSLHLRISVQFQDSLSFLV